MRSSGCLLQGLLVFLVTIIILGLLGPAVGNVFSEITTELDGSSGPVPTMMVITAVPPPTLPPTATLTPVPTPTP